MTLGALFPALFVAVVATIVIANLWIRSRRLRRAAFVRDYHWPPGLLDKLERRYADFTRKETALVGQGLRQFFLAHLSSGNRYVAMPSKVVDDLWHEFILYTRAYQDFCRDAFGSFLHHTPAVALSPTRKQSNEGLRRVWWFACKEENIDPRQPTRLPLLFALDTKLNIPGGYRYVPDCGDLRRGGAAGAQCGADFGSSSVDGGTDGFGDGGDGGGDGSGCGGSGD
jgi:hypothetical protein